MATHFFNGIIYTDSRTKTSSLYVDDEGLVCTEDSFNSSTSQESIDLVGTCLIPSFRDGHAHPVLAGREALSVDISAATTTDELGKLISSYHKVNPQLTWLEAGPYNRAIAGSLDSRTLDSFVSSIPVILHADDHHTIWVNSKALEIAGLTAFSAPRFKTIGVDLDHNRRPTGILRETAAKNIVLKHAPEKTIEQDSKALRIAEDILIRSGITELQDAWVDAQIFHIYKRLKGELRLNYYLALSLSPATLAEDFKFITEAKSETLTSNVTVHAVKIFVDGVFGSATAAVSEPYLSSNNHGQLNWSKPELLTALIFLKDIGLQAHLHAIGDYAVSFALDVIQESGTENAVIAHAELTNPEIIARCKELGVTLCVQPYWAQRNDLLNSCLNNLGENRLNSLYAFRSFLEAGLNIAFSSDWPVSSVKPIEGITAAIHRRILSSQTPHNQTEAITLEQALDAYTSGVSMMLRGEPTMLNLGSDFDAVILNKDLMQQDLEGMNSLEVLAVYKKGTKLFPHHQD